LYDFIFRSTNVTLAAVAIVILSFSYLLADDAIPVGVPDNLKVTGSVVAHVRATGFQVYTCMADATGKLAWVLKGPDATFEDDHGLKGKHYPGPAGSTAPTWESTIDGSKVVGKKIADHASPNADAVPWLLLSAASHAGAGVFTSVTFIQRINTTGGKAPAIAQAKPGDETRVPYTAEYVFFGPGATTQPTP
jgi:hypothetical protein